VARRDQPYLPLFVNDFMTDEKLANCSAESTGVYIRLMCLMHKSQEYGKILLRQKFRQTDRQISNFAEMLVKHLPYSKEVIERSIEELIEEEVIFIDGNALCQKRMIKDGYLSQIRSNSGRKGAKSTNRRNRQADFAAVFAAAKTAANHSANSSANSEIENEDEDVNENETEISSDGISTVTEEVTPLGTVFDYYQTRINARPSSLVIEGLKAFTEELGADVVVHAMQIALDERKTSWSYIKAILARYRRDGLTSMDAVLLSEQRHESAKNAGQKPQNGNYFLELAGRDDW